MFTASQTIPLFSQAAIAATLKAARYPGFRSQRLRAATASARRAALPHLVPSRTATAKQTQTTEMLWAILRGHKKVEKTT